jgi:glutathione S-transferase
MKLIIGNKAYSSWSLRAWLAARHSGLAFDELVVPLYDDAWEIRKTRPDLIPSNGKVPILWDGDAAVWESLAIIDWLDERTGGELGFWPDAKGARAMARSIATEMHAGFAALRRNHSMNVRRSYAPQPLLPEVAADVARIVHLWDAARTRFGHSGDCLFGAWSAADIMFAPVVSRFVTYAIPVPDAARTYMDVVMAHPDMADWIAAAHAEPWVIDRFEGAAQG